MTENEFLAQLRQHAAKFVQKERDAAAALDLRRRQRRDFLVAFYEKVETVVEPAFSIVVDGFSLHETLRVRVKPLDQSDTISLVVEAASPRDSAMPVKHTLNYQATSEGRIAVSGSVGRGSITLEELTPRRVEQDTERLFRAISEGVPFAG